MTVKPGDRETNPFCGCVMEFTAASEWRTVERCGTHHQHSWACETCPMGPFDDEAMRAVLDTASDVAVLAAQIEALAPAPVAGDVYRTGQYRAFMAAADWVRTGELSRRF